MKRFSAFTVCLSALFILMLAAAAFGQDPQGQPDNRADRHQARELKKMDANRDGQITRDEWKGRPRAFSWLDQNNDGAISREEARAAGRERGNRRLKRMDANHDGQIARGEWSGNPDAFSKLDANNDRVITKDELKAGRHNARRPPQ